MKQKTIAFVAGKSGGHIIPCLTIAENNCARGNERSSILFFSSNTDLDKKILANNPLVSWHIMLPLSTRAGSLLKTLWHALYSFILSFFYLCKHRPIQIITTGGIVAIPTCIAGFVLRIPITLYSLDAVPGKAIRFLTPLATSIITCFESSQRYFPAHKCTVQPYPVKYQNMINLPDQHTALRALCLSSEKKTIVILGGSQGSLFLNNCMKQLVNDPSFDGKSIQIIHQTGSLDATDWNNFYKEKNITAYVFSYMPHLEQIYEAADLIICRAGAGTLFEVKFFNKPCIIIPLETNTTTHQVDNARAMHKEHPGVFRMLLQKNIEKNSAILFEKINVLLWHK
jgi:UDP-N-acetylglucosamine--N-acetylmuramyl-(pentapeptide) pyrophosphoryl-undecaprenol N-acetylglucosamine transferase